MRRLIVVVPAIRLGFHGWEALLDRLQSEPGLAGASWLPWDHKKRWFSLASASRIAADLRARIDQEWAAKGPFDDVVLAGYSLGALLVRQAYLLGSGADPVTGRRSDWSAVVSRIVLLAGINRGIAPRRWWLRAAAWSARMFPPLQRLLSWDLLRGSDFVANLRIEWIRHFSTLGEHEPVVAQVLGTRDTLVSAADSIDIEQFPNGYYIEVSEATHDNLHRLDLASDPDGRYALLRDAFVHDRPRLAQNRTFNGAAQVVFVLHGIRANNKTWVRDIAATIRARWPDVAVVAPQYPFVSALKFAVPMIRRRYLRWFQDAYTEALAHNPAARFAFIGHSNGTYLFGESLRRLPGIRFERAVLVGAALPTAYDWKTRVQRDQLRALRVDGSAYDWPVGWLASALHAVGMRDIGTSGYDGFSAFPSSSQIEHLWYPGGHSAPLTSANLVHIAEYAVSGMDRAPDSLRSEAKWFSFVSRALRWLAPAAVAGLLVLLVWLGYHDVRILAVVLVGLALLVVLLDIF